MFSFEHLHTNLLVWHRSFPVFQFWFHCGIVTLIKTSFKVLTRLSEMLPCAAGCSSYPDVAGRLTESWAQIRQPFDPEPWLAHTEWKCDSLDGCPAPTSSILSSGAEPVLLLWLQLRESGVCVEEAAGQGRVTSWFLTLLRGGHLQCRHTHTEIHVTLWRDKWCCLLEPGGVWQTDGQMMMMKMMCVNVCVHAQHPINCVSAAVISAALQFIYVLLFTGSLYLYSCQKSF